MEREETRNQTSVTLSDRDRIHDLLLMEKSMSTAYFQAARESANLSLRQALDALRQRSAVQHVRLFQAMHERNWIQTPTAGQQAIESAVIQWEQQQVRNPELRP